MHVSLALSTLVPDRLLYRSIALEVQVAPYSSDRVDPVYRKSSQYCEVENRLFCSLDVSLLVVVESLSGRS